MKKPKKRAAKKKLVAKTQKPVKVKELFKTKKVKQPKNINMGNCTFNETLATNDDGDPIVTQTIVYKDNRVVKCTIFDAKNDVVITKTYD